MADPLLDNVVNFEDHAAEYVAGVSFDDYHTPERAARAIELGDTFGVPPAAVYADVENFDKKKKAQLSADLVRNNPQLAEYVAASPMNARLSQDDWVNLDALDEPMKRLGSQGILETFAKSLLVGRAQQIGMGLIEGRDRIGAAALEGYGWASQQKEFDKTLQMPWAKAFFGTEQPGILGMPGKAAFAGVFAFDSFMRAFNAGMYALSEVAGVTAEKMGEDPAWARRLVRDTYQTLQVASAGPVFGGASWVKPVADMQVRVPQVKGIKEPMTAAHPWLLEGKEPPVGLHPEIDKIKIEQSTAHLDALNAAIKAAQDSTTREASPRIYAEYARLYPEAKIGINIDAFDRLYGDKLPSPEDGKLGWAPGIMEQIEAARLTGGDIEIPLADYIANIDPKLNKELVDNIRVKRGDLTKAEIETAREAEVGEPRPQTPAESIRQAAALEPMFAVGDRKLGLKLTKEWAPVADEGPGHTFELMDEKGKAAGYIATSLRDGGKTIYVDQIAGVGDYGPTSFGPSLIRDILRQLKEQFPDAENIAGFRMSGAREKAGTVKSKGEVSAKFSLLEFDTPQKIADLLDEQMKWMEVSPYLNIGFKPEFAPHEQALIKGVDDVFKRILPNFKGLATAAHAIEIEGRRVNGVWQPFADRFPIIAVALDARDPMGIARHEAIHQLRQYGHFTDAEWATLVKAAKDGKWIELYDINKRYKGEPWNVMFEESIAEAYRGWSEGKPVAPELNPIFKKMKELFDAIKDKFREILGREPTFEDIFERVESGKVGARDGKPRSKQDYAGPMGAERQLEMPEATRMEDRKAFSPAPPGMSKERYDRYSKLIAERQKQDFERDYARAKKQEAKRQTAEWKAEANSMRPEVAEQVTNRPDIAADRFFRDGDLYGEKVEKIKIAEEYLTPEERAVLPSAYVSKKGMNPDDVAGLFGFESGQALVGRLSQFHAEWKASGLRKDDFIRQMITSEVNRRMELKHGLLEENILEAAKEQALSENQLSILHEQTIHLAEQAGLQYPLDKAQLQQKAMEHFNNLNADGISSDRFLAEAGRAGRAAELNLLKKDFQEAFKQAQRQEFATIYAKEALKIEKQQARFERLAKRYNSRELPKGRDRNYALHAMGLLERAGYSTKLSEGEILRELNADDYPTLARLVESSVADGYPLGDFVSEQLMAEGPKPKEQMSVSEQREFMQAVTALDHVARDVEKIIRNGEKVDRAELFNEVKANMERRPLVVPETRNKLAQLWWGFDAINVKMENLAKDFDFRQEMGPMWDVLIRGQELSKNKAMQLEAQINRSFKELPGATYTWRKSLSKEIENPIFKDPAAPTQPIIMRRENMLRVMLNLGTEGNRYKLAEGVAIVRDGRDVRKMPERIEQVAQQIESWVNKHATEQDWKFVKHVWDQHAQLRPEVERVQRNTSGVIPIWVEGRKIATPFGEIEGNYYPLSPDRARQLPDFAIAFDGDAPQPKGAFNPEFHRAKTPQSYLKARTSRPYFVDVMSPIENVALELKAVINDVAYREFGINAGKIIYDPKYRDLINRRYGPEYQKQMVPWLKAVLNIDNDNTQNMGLLYQAMRFARVNTVHSALGFNLATLLTPSVGTLSPKSYASYMTDRRANRAMVMDLSKELQNIETLVDRDLNTSASRMIKTSVASEIYNDAVKASFEAIKIVQMGFARVSFYEKFHEGKAKGLSDTAAAEAADVHIRERHGSTGRADMGALLRSQDEFVKWSTMFMGYYNTVYNYRRTMVHNAKQMVKGETPAEKQLAWKEFRGAALYGVLVPILVTAVFYTRPKQDESWLSFLSRALASETLGGLAGFREVNFWLESGRTGTSAIASLVDSIYKPLKDAGNAWQGKKVEKPFQNTMTAAGAVGLPGGMALGRTFGGLHNVYRGTEPPPRDIGEYYRLIRWGESKVKK